MIIPLFPDKSSLSAIDFLIVLNNLEQMSFLILINGITFIIGMAVCLVDKTNKFDKAYNIILRLISVYLLLGVVFLLIVFFNINGIKNVKLGDSENGYIVTIKNKLNIDESQFEILDSYPDYRNLELFICLNNIENSMSDNRSKEICNKVISSYKDIRKNEKQKFKQMNFRELKQREIDKKYNIHVD